MTHTKGGWIADIRVGCCAVYPKDRAGDTNGCHKDDERNIYFSGKATKNEKLGSWDLDEESKANAYLISAASNLLEACEESLISFRLIHAEYPHLDIAPMKKMLVNAINKSKGV